MKFEATTLSQCKLISVNEEQESTAKGSEQDQIIKSNSYGQPNIEIIDKPNENEESNFWFLDDLHALIEENQEKEKSKEPDDKAASFAFVSKASGETTYSHHTQGSFSNFFEDEYDTSFIIHEKGIEKRNAENIESKMINSGNDGNHELLLLNIISQAENQLTCRHLQETIKANPQLANEYFDKLISSSESLKELIIHPYGNYFIQSLTRQINEDQREVLLLSIESFFPNIALNFYGTRVVQNFIASIQSNKLFLLLVKVCTCYLETMVSNINGTHIIFNLLSLNNQYATQVIVNQVNAKLMGISLDKHGSCFVQRIIQLQPLMCNKIIDNLICNSLMLLTDQFGHYAIKFILSMNSPYYNSKLIQAIVPHFLQLANQRFSSTVLEFCFEVCDNNSKQYLYNAIANYDSMRELLINQFGNYVLQKAIDFASANTRNYLFMLLAPTMFSLKRDTFGKQLFCKICVKYPAVKSMVNAMKGKRNPNWK